jgi:hypothetical protein
MASVAALHRTLLEMHHTLPESPLSLPHPHMHPSTHYHPRSSIPHSPNHEIEPTHGVSDSHTEPSPTAITRKVPSPLVSAQPSRKRQRTSRDSSSPRYTASKEYTSIAHDSAPSPCSSSRSNSVEYSPRSRASMAIGSLLSPGPSSDDISGRGRANDYISPSTSFAPISV